MEAGRLAGKLALVTGGGSGIGRSVCQLFAREGARVAVVDINEDNAHATREMLLGGEHMYNTCDVSLKTGVQNLISSVKERFGQAPSIAINCAGVTRDGFMISMEEEHFDEVIRINLKGTFLVAQAVSQLLVSEKQTGSIVNLSSLVGKTGNIGQANYAASKAGVIGLTKTIAQEMGRFGIRCNVVLPGFIETPMTETVPDKIITRIKKMIPAGRLGQADEVAEACLFLASDQSSYITGANIEVTGGLFA